MSLTVSKLFCGYNKNKMIINDICFTLAEGEVLAVLGPNGSGKTTLFKALLGFIPAVKGRVVYDGSDVLSMPPPLSARIFSYIPQHHAPVFSYSVAEIVMMGRAGHVQMFANPGVSDKKAVNAALDQLKITHLKDRPYTRLSGGERQLVLIARALCQQAKIIVMDEPGSDLDYANQQLIANTILSLKQSGYSIILSSHANEYPFAVADNALLLKNGHTVAYGPPRQSLSGEALSKAFGTAMNLFEVTDSNGNLRTVCLPVN